MVDILTTWLVLSVIIAPIVGSLLSHHRDRPVGPRAYPAPLSGNGLIPVPRTTSAALLQSIPAPRQAPADPDRFPDPPRT